MREVQEDEDKKPVYSTSRIASLDFARGLAIFLMTFFHCFHHIYNPDWFAADPSKIFDYPLVVVIIVGILIFLGTWNSFFLLVSSTVTTFSMVRTTKKLSSPKMIFFKNMLTAIGLFIVNHLIESWGWYGYIGTSLRTNNWTNLSIIWEKFYLIATLEIIAWSIIITSIINYFLLRKKGYEKYKRNMIVYGILVLVILIATPFVQNIIDQNITDWPFSAGRPGFRSVWILALVRIAGNLEPFFPILATGLIGAMLGLTFAREKPLKRLPLIGFLIALVCFLTGLGLIWGGMELIIFSRVSLATYLLQIGGQLALLMLLFRLIEYRGKGEKFANNKLVRLFRKWGMIAMSIYALEILDLLPKWTLNLIFGQRYGLNFFEKIFGFGELQFGLAVALYSMIYYFIFIELWAKINFHFSYEWFLIRFQSLATKTVSPRLNVNVMLNQIEWINFKENKNKRDINNK